MDYEILQVYYMRLLDLDIKEKQQTGYVNINLRNKLEKKCGGRKNF